MTTVLADPLQRPASRRPRSRTHASRAPVMRPSAPASQEAAAYADQRPKPDVDDVMAVLASFGLQD